MNSTYLDLPVHISSPLGYLFEDTLDWIPLSGYYVAQGGEDHLLIGNFRSDAQTSYSVHMPGSNENYAFYYIDDVSLTQVDDSIDLGPDTMLCIGATLEIDIRLPEATYQWADGFTEGIRLITAPGLYSVKVNIGQCSPLQDSIRVSFISPPEVWFGGDTSLCYGQELNLSAASPYGHYAWHDGSNDPYYQVRDAGTYSVEVTNPCGADGDTIEVDFMDCQGLLFAPNAFTPNADGVNDQFRLVGSGIYRIDLRIFDRWGREVFQSNDPGASWDGNSAGNPLPAGIYQWVATYTGSGATRLEREGRKHGMVILLR
ncbi:MAG: gliding motility-associated C-terminal domain-containing protein [Bacteroidales bacterium]|nr:gliding motility-associated C-terminal domain-containing protein [Bacteroidales bacterium]